LFQATGFSVEKLGSPFLNLDPILKIAVFLFLMVAAKLQPSKKEQPHRIFGLFKA
jgi:hypothetical protein